MATGVHSKLRNIHFDERALKEKGRRPAVVLNDPARNQNLEDVFLTVLLWRGRGG
jgi:mRNA-degrading endonuclease toxin of MazEF toxin-antitoxin module